MGNVTFFKVCSIADIEKRASVFYMLNYSFNLVIQMVSGV